MSKSVNPIPEGFSTATPMIMVNGLQPILAFVQKAFDAEITHMVNTSDGEPWHANVKIGDSMLMFGDTMGEHPAAPACIYLYGKDANAMYDKAVKAGGKSIQEPKDMFYGDRSGGVTDPAGNMWWVATKIEDLSDEEINRRAAKEEQKMKAKSGSQKKAA